MEKFGDFLKNVYTELPYDLAFPILSVYKRQQNTGIEKKYVHVNVWQKPLQYCKVISLQLIKNKWKKNMKKILNGKKMYLNVHDSTVHK